MTTCNVHFKTSILPLQAKGMGNGNRSVKPARELHSSGGVLSWTRVGTEQVWNLGCFGERNNGSCLWDCLLCMRVKLRKTSGFLSEKSHDFLKKGLQGNTSGYHIIIPMKSMFPMTQNLEATKEKLIK